MKEFGGPKISIARVVNSLSSDFSCKPIPSLPNHISWAEPPSSLPTQSSTFNSKPKRKHKIFQKDTSSSSR